MNDRLSAVPFFEMVRTPNNSIILSTEDNRPQRSSSVGNAFRRLFSKSPVPEQERSSSENAASSLGQQTPSPQRGRHLPTSALADTWETSTLPPNNPYYRPVRAHPRAAWTKGGKGGLFKQQSQHYSSEQVSAGAMASHRGGHPEVSTSGGGGSWREHSGGAVSTIVISEIPQVQSDLALVSASQGPSQPMISPVSALPGQSHSVQSVLAPVVTPSAYQDSMHRTKCGEIRSHDVDKSISIAESSSIAATHDGIPKVTKISKDSTNIIVHYSVPTGTRYLPIAIGDKITMVFM